MKRVGLKLAETGVAWKYANNTVIISYDKPKEVLAAES